MFLPHEDKREYVAILSDINVSGVGHDERCGTHLLLILEEEFEWISTVFDRRPDERKP
jgi:hypothetical protein